MLQLHRPWKESFGKMGSFYAICPEIPFENRANLALKITNLFKAASKKNIYFGLRFPHWKSRRTIKFIDELCNENPEIIGQLLVHTHPELMMVFPELRGIHIPEKSYSAHEIKQKFPEKLILKSCHKLEQVNGIMDKGISPLISPIFSVAKKGKPLGIKSLLSISKDLRPSVFLLGGFDYEKTKLANSKNFSVAGIRSWQKSENQDKIVSIYN